MPNNNLWSLSNSMFCSLPSLTSLNMSTNYRQQVTDFGNFFVFILIGIVDDVVCFVDVDFSLLNPFKCKIRSLYNIIHVTHI